MYILYIDVDLDPDPVGSAFIWIQRYKMKRKEFFFRRKFSSLNLKKGANLKGLGTDLICSYLLWCYLIIEAPTSYLLTFYQST